MIFIAEDFEIYLKDEAFFNLMKYEQINGKKESGGILLGKVYDKKIVIEKITTPKWTDFSSLFSFIRNRSGHQEIIKKEWKSSQGNIVYLGEWHTHSEFLPIPSEDDKKLLSEIGKYQNVKYPVIMLILGLNGNVWIGVNNSGKTFRAQKYKLIPHL